MKNLIILAVGLGLIGAGVITTSNASRDAYHAYLNSEDGPRNERYFVDHYGSSPEGFQKRAPRVEGRNRFKYVRSIRNLRYSQSNTRYSYSRREKAQVPASPKSPTRSISRSIEPWQKPLNRTRKATIANFSGGQKVLLNTYENDRFSIQLPNGWEAVQEGGHVFTQRNSDFRLRVKRFQEGTCGTRGFMGCAIALGVSENESQAIKGDGKILISSTIKRLSQKNDTVLNKINISTQTYNEQFNAVLPNVDKEKTVSRYFVQDQDGGVFLIEAVSNYQNAGKYIEATKRIFDSFRVYPQA